MSIFQAFHIQNKNVDYIKLTKLRPKFKIFHPVCIVHPKKKQGRFNPSIASLTLIAKIGVLIVPKLF